MYRLNLVVLMSVFLFACSPNIEFQSENTKPLSITSISIVSPQEERNYYPQHSAKQIVFEFNQDVALLGAVPSLDQIASVSISRNLKEKCTWRFVGLNKMSCELITRLISMTDYVVKIEHSFEGLGKKLTHSTSKTLSTPNPIIEFRPRGEVGSFPEKVFFNLNLQTDISIESLKKSLLIKTPDGVYKDLSIEKEHENSPNSFIVTFPKSSKSWPAGKYKFVLPIGFQASESQRVLTQEIVLDDFRYNNQFEFYGFACNKWREYQEISLDDNGLLACDPKNVALSFSMPVKRKFEYNANEKINWLSGGQYKNYRNSERRDQYYSLVELQGEREYTVDLSKVLSVNGLKVLNPRVINFSTQESTSMWEVNLNAGSVIESDSQSTPMLVRQNVDVIQSSITPINNSNQLLDFLNDISLETKQSSLKLETGNKNDLTAQPIDFKQYLSSVSGLANVKLTGLSKTNEYENDKVVEKTRTFMANSAAYNLTVWHKNELLIYASSWQAVSLDKVEVTLACEGLDSTRRLGETNKQGLLWIKQAEWMKIHKAFEDNECWLWSTKGKQSSAIKLPVHQRQISDETNATAWSAQPIYQPGEDVSLGFIARQRGSSGLQSLRNLDSYSFAIRVPGRKKDAPIIFSKLSQQGFASSRFELDLGAALGRYRVVMKDVQNEVESIVAEFMVAEYTVPEFEQHLKIPNRFKYGQSVAANVNAKRMNGAALTNASTKIHYEISRNYMKPKSWPKNYEFDSWEDFESNKDGSEKIKAKRYLLDSNGEFDFASKPISSNVPMGKLTVTSEITSDDGETQFTQQQADYFSRTHYIGTRFHDDSKSLEIIAVNVDGQLLTSIASEVSIFKERDKDNSKEDRKVLQCSFSKLPAFCDASSIIKSNETKPFKVEIISGSKKYLWHRGFYFSESDFPNPADVTMDFELTSDNNEILAGDKITFNLKSSVDGEATLIIQAGSVQKNWKESIKKGNNKIELISDNSWQPYARLYVVMPVDKKKVKRLTISKLQSLTDKLGTDSRDYPLNELLRSERFVKSSKHFIVKPRSVVPKVCLAVEESNVQAGSTVELSITSNVNSESQLWLVNEALMPMLNINDSEFDYQTKIHNLHSFERQLHSKSLIDDLILDSSLEKILLHDVGSLNMRNRMASKGAALMMLAEGQIGGDAELKQAFAQSVWLDTLMLTKSVPSKIKIKLPQLIGRWKVFALTATQQQFSLDTTSISTTRDIEYFIDSPVNLFDDDNAKFAITQINRTGRQVTDQLSVWLGKNLISKIDVKLNPNEYKRVNFQLPSLTPGNNRLLLTSRRFDNFKTVHNIKLKKAEHAVQNTWLVNSSNSNEVAIPDNHLPDSLRLSVLSADAVSPDWESLAGYNKNYPHQCWEQTLSRAVSYHYNPIAKKHWLEGEETLNRLLGMHNKYKQYSGQYSYFPNQSADSFLTAYTYLVHGWLLGTANEISANGTELKRLNKEYVSDTVKSKYHSVGAHTKSMALLALAQNKDIDLETAKLARQKIGSGDAYSTALQALALKTVGAEKSLYINDLLALESNQYKDVNSNLFNQNSHKCIAALVFDKGSEQRTRLVSEVLMSQQKEGTFGSTIANAFCGYLLTDKTGNNGTFLPVKYSVDNAVIKLKASNEPQYWLRMDFLQGFDDINVQSNGLHMKRLLFVQQADNWISVAGKASLKVGDIIKVSIIIDSPVEREHVVVVDSIAGGFEPINPEFKNQLYIKSYSRGWQAQNRIEINDGKATWYLRKLKEGHTELSYFSRVRHSGEYNLAPASAETMYRSDVNALTSATKVFID